MKARAFENLQGELNFDYPLARHTSWRVGGNAECCYRPKNLHDLATFLKQVPAQEPLTWLGLGSNVLIRDGGLEGTVILTVNRLSEMDLVDRHLVRAEAGVTCAKLAKFCVTQGYESGAFFAGIPGTVGGALAMNAGAYGGETWTYVVKVETIDRFGNTHVRYPVEFSPRYRHVQIPKDEYFVAGYFDFPVGDAIQAKELVSALLKKRNASQPIGSYSCGSVFRNPAGDYAARLVEQVGLKGFCMGDAQVSLKHANFILNIGKARAADIEALIQYVAAQVQQQCGIELIPEVRILGRPAADQSA
jgi:UDP-N-acetylmuramate dehydrogenase